MRHKILLLLVFVLVLAVTPVMAQEGDRAWVRVFHLALDWTDVDTYWGGDLILEATQPVSASDWVAVETGTITFSVAEVGTGMVNTVLEVTDVTLEAGHRYTIAIVGQMADDSLSTLFIDETAEIADFDMSQGSAIMTINNIAGAPAVTFLDNEIVQAENVGYDDLVTTFIPAMSWDTSIVVEHDNPDNVLFEFDTEADGIGGFWEPYTVYLFGMAGTYPGEVWNDYGLTTASHYTVAENPIQFLEAFTGKNLYNNADSGVVYEFTTLLSLIDEAGLTDTLTGITEQPFTLFAPTDYAFAQLPEGALDELRDDPELLQAVLLNHLVDENLDLSAMETLTTSQGTEYDILFDEESFSYLLNNDIIVNSFAYPLGSGSVWLINNGVLLP